MLFIKKIELFLNIVLYGVYRSRMVLRQCVMLPYRLIYKIHFLQAKKHQDRKKTVEKVGRIISSGYIIGDSRGLIIGGIGAFLFPFVIFLCQLAFFCIEWLNMLWLSVFISMMIGFLIEYFFITKGNRYVKYFNEFDKRSRKKKGIYMIIGVGFILFCFGGFIFNLWLGWLKIY